MSKLKIKKRVACGATLIEVICSLAIFSIIFLCVISMEIVSLKLNKENLNNENNILVVEAIKNEIIYNMSYDAVNKLKIKKNPNDINYIYINKENINMKSIAEKTIDNILINVKPTDKPYIVLSIVENQNVMNVTISLTVNNLNSEKTIEHSFYKGNY